MITHLEQLTTGQRIAVGVIYVAVCFALGMAIGALLTRRPR